MKTKSQFQPSLNISNIWNADASDIQWGIIRDIEKDGSVLMFVSPEFGYLTAWKCCNTCVGRIGIVILTDDRIPFLIASRYKSFDGGLLGRITSRIRDAWLIISDVLKDIFLR